MLTLPGHSRIWGRRRRRGSKAYRHSTRRTMWNVFVWNGGRSSSDGGVEREVWRRSRGPIRKSSGGCLLDDSCHVE